MALIEGDLMDVAAIGVHDMEYQRGFTAAFLHGGKLGFALIQQDGLGLPLAAGGENNTAIRQVVWGNILSGLGRDIRADHPPQPICRNVVLPDIPGRLVLGIRSLDFRGVHGKQQFAAIIGAFHIPDISLTAGFLKANIPFPGAERGQIAEVEVAARLKIQHRAAIAGVAVTQGLLDIGNAEGFHDRVDASTAATARQDQ